MKQTFKTPDLTLKLHHHGLDEYTKISYPVTYGVYSEIETRDLVLQFNLNHEIRRAKAKNRHWIHPSEWLKRSKGNDWIYYSTGGYTGVFEAIGEYYLPNLQYPTNALIGGKPFCEEGVNNIVTHWHDHIKTIAETPADLPAPVRDFLEQVLKISPSVLQQRAQDLFSISGGRITVMPPDARHVDYDIIPITISEGCLYKCRFCRIKTEKPFRTLEKRAIDDQITKLKHLYGADIRNYSSVFLGEHDALNADPDTLLYAAGAAYKAFGLDSTYMKPRSIFLFGSVDSLMNAGKEFFDALDHLPFSTYINIGLESADQETLDRLGKPITRNQVIEAFDRIQEINSERHSIEVSANFIMDENLPEGHYPSFLELVRERIPHTRPKGSVYLSPLRIGRPSREVLFDFNRLKALSRLPTYLYIIQRL